MKQTLLLGATALVAVGLLNASEARASTLVATIYGVYDAASCGNSASCLTPPSGQTLAPGYATNLGLSGSLGASDTPSLFINNNTAFSFSNITITLNAYQGINNGSMTTVPVSQISTIAPNTLYQLAWSQSGAGFGNPLPSGGSTTSANLFSYDYDDYYQTFVAQSGCILGSQYCANPGNFNVTFTATWNNPAFGPMGTPIFAQFSPDNTQFGGMGNVQGTFVGWEGLDPNGLSETAFDNHTGAETGVLADIFIGTPTSGVPEPSTWAMMLLGFAGLGFAFRHSRRKVSFA
jgi:hypothetical protein